MEKASQIYVSQQVSINFDEYTKYFKVKLYESFKPKNLAEARQYIDYLIFNKNSEQFKK